MTTLPYLTSKSERNDGDGPMSELEDSTSTQCSPTCTPTSVIQVAPGGAA